MTTEPLHRRYQFSLRWMLGTFALLAVVFAAAGYLLQAWHAGEEGRRRHRMNNLILSNGGYWGSQEDGNFLTLMNATKVQLDTVLKELKMFDGQRSMCFDNGEFCDAHVKELLCHRGLTDLKLNNTLVTDNSLKDIVVLKELIGVMLDNTAIMDAGLEHLVELPELQYLMLDNTAITDAGLEHLAKLPKLEHLHVTGTKVTEEGIATLKRSLPNLEVNVYHGR